MEITAKNIADIKEAINQMPANLMLDLIYSKVINMFILSNGEYTHNENLTRLASGTVNQVFDFVMNYENYVNSFVLDNWSDFKQIA